MAGNEVTIRIGTDLSEVEASGKKLGSALEGAASGGIAGFERVQQRVIELTKQIAQLRGELLKTSDPAQQQRLNAALGQAQKQFQAARGEMRGMTMESREANEKVQMLAASLGVRVPAGLAQIMARLPGVQAAMEVAFGATIVVAFGAAIVALFPKIADWIDQLRGVEEVNQDLLNQQIELNNYLVAAGKPKSLKALEVQFQNVSGRIGEIKQKLLELQGAPWSFERLKFGLRAATDLGLTMDRIRALRAELGPLEEKLGKLGLAVPTEKQEEYNRALEEAAKHAKELADQLWRVEWAQEHGLDAAVKAAVIEIEYIAKTRDALAQLPPLIGDTQFALKNLPPVIQEIQARSELANAAMVKDMKAQDETAKTALDQQEKLAHGIESFIDRVFIQARSLSDVFHQFLMQTLGSFVKWISQMLAHWLTGIRQATAGAGGGGGGILGSLGSILGGVFGIGGGASALTAGQAGMAAGGGGWATQAGQAALPIGMGGMALATGGEIPNAVGGAAQGTLGALAFHPGQFLAGQATMLAGMGILGGIALAGGGGPVRGALGGALAGGGIGLGLYSLGLLGGPWGLVLAGIGAAIGGLVGLFRRGGQKRKASALEQQFEFGANDLLEQFKQFKIDYDSALAGMQELIAQGQQTLTSAGLGRWGRQGAEGLTRTIQDEIRALEALQKQREARAVLMAGMTIPEFAAGGPVGFRTADGAILGLIHPGEFVMRREAVDALGGSFLAALNRAPRFALGGPVSPPSPLSAGQQGGIHIHGDLILQPAKDMSDREAMQMVVRGFKRAVRDGAL